MYYGRSVGGGLCWDRGAFCHFALLLQPAEFGFGFTELFLEGGIGVEACDCDCSCDASGIDVALEVVAAYHAAFAHFISAFEYLVLTFGIDFGEDQGCSPSDGCVS